MQCTYGKRDTTFCGVVNDALPPGCKCVEKTLGFDAACAVHAGPVGTIQVDLKVLPCALPSNMGSHISWSKEINGVNKSFSYTIASVVAGKKKVEPIPGLSIVLFDHGLGFMATIVVNGNADKLNLQMGLDACAEGVPHYGTLCASHDSYMNPFRHIFPIHVLNITESFGDTCKIAKAKVAKAAKAEAAKATTGMGAGGVVGILLLVIVLVGGVVVGALFVLKKGPFGELQAEDLQTEGARYSQADK